MILTPFAKGFIETSARKNSRSIYGYVPRRSCLMSRLIVFYQDLLRVNSLICELAALYYSRVLNTTFQENYLGTRECPLFLPGYFPQ